MKIRCSGENPVSGRLGRPRGTKNKRPAEDKDSGPARQRARTSEKQRQGSVQEPKQQSPGQDSTRFINHHGSQIQSPISSSAQITDTFGNSQDTPNPLILDTALYENPYDSPFSFSDSRLGWDTPNFDIPQLPTTNKDAQDTLTSPLKDPFAPNNVTMEEILPKAFWLSAPYPSPIEPLSTAPTIIDSESPLTTSPSNHSDSYTAKPFPDPYATTPPTPQSAVLPPLLSPSSPSIHCTCFQQNADILCTLKTSQIGSNVGDPCQSPSLGSVLSSVQEAFKAWRSLIECRECSSNTEQEVLLLALMSIRILLVRIQAQLHSGPDSPISTPSEPGRPLASMSNFARGHRVTIGEHELGEKDQWLVVQVLLLNTVRRIKAAMNCFNEMLERKRKAMMANGLTGTLEVDTGFDQVAPMLQNLGGMVGNLEKCLEGC
ncbi:MAG: hypothetical protein Q9227_004531 [Pyrenula ochraceoflavens]